MMTKCLLTEWNMRGPQSLSYSGRRLDPNSVLWLGRLRQRVWCELWARWSVGSWGLWILVRESDAFRVAVSRNWCATTTVGVGVCGACLSDSGGNPLARDSWLAVVGTRSRTENQSTDEKRSPSRRGSRRSHKKICILRGHPVDTGEDSSDEDGPLHVPKSTHVVSGMRHHWLPMLVDHLTCQHGKSEVSLPETKGCEDSCHTSKLSKRDEGPASFSLGTTDSHLSRTVKSTLPWSNN